MQLSRKKKTHEYTTDHLLLSYALLSGAVNLVDDFASDDDELDEEAFAAQLQARLGCVEGDADVANSEAKDAFMHPSAKASPKPPPHHADPAASSTGTGLSPLRHEVAELRHMLSSALSSSGRGKKEKKKGKDIEEQPPAVTISKEALDWKPDEKAPADARRMKWPLENRYDHPFDEFRNYLVNEKGLKLVSAGMHVQKLQYFYGMLEFDSDDFSHIGFVANLYKSGLINDMQKLQIFQPTLPTTRNIVSALSHFCDFVLLSCGRQNLREATRCITLLKTEVLASFKKRIQKERTASSAKKRALDSEAIEHLPPPEVLKAAIKESMIDLRTLLCLSTTEGHDDWQLKYAANVIMAGIIFTNGYAGRPGEWSAMTRKQVEEFIASGLDHLVIKEHKTAKVHGPLGRWVADGTRDAMRTLLQIHDKDAVRFIHAVKDTGNLVHMSSVLKKWASVYTPGHTPPTATIMRKWFHTAAESDTTGKARQFEALCSMDGHSVKTGKKIYVVAKPKKQAAVAKAMYLSFVGEPVGWPDASELQACRAASEARINANFYRQAAGSDSECRDDDDKDQDDTEDDVVASGPDQDVGAASAAADDVESTKDNSAAKSSASPSCGAVASEADGEPKKKRRIELDKAAGKFIKHDPEPNLIIRDPVEEKVHLKLTDVGVHRDAGECLAAPPRRPASSSVDSKPVKDKVQVKFADVLVQSKEVQAAAEVAPPPSSSASAASADARHRLAQNPLRKGPFTQKQKDYIAKESFKVMQHFEKGKSPSNIFLNQILQEGIAAGELPNNTTLEQVRNVARNHEPPKDARCFRHSAV